jgi:hypothetical protein
MQQLPEIQGTDGVTEGREKDFERERSSSLFEIQDWRWRTICQF